MGYSYLLALEDGTPAEPATFTTTHLDWDVGDVLELGARGQLLVIGVDGEPIGDEAHGLLVVKPLD